MASQGRRPILDQLKRREILAILSVGCSRRTAARYVGCSPRTIAKTAERDPQFAAELRRAENKAEISYMKNIQKAAAKEQYWRAAAWALERRNPQEFAPRKADVVTFDQLRELLAQFGQIIIEEVPAEYRKKVIKRLGRLSARVSGRKRPQKGSKR